MPTSTRNLHPGQREIPQVHVLQRVPEHFTHPASRPFQSPLQLPILDDNVRVQHACDWHTHPHFTHPATTRQLAILSAETEVEPTPEHVPERELGMQVLQRRVLANH